MFTDSDKQKIYSDTMHRIWLLIDDSTDWIAALSTIVSELHSSFDQFHWTGFYRTVRNKHLQVGPYQGEHGCIDIPFSQGVCGAAARLRMTQLIRDVREFEGHIACSPTTLSEIVVPVLDSHDETVAVLDIDSNELEAFDDTDRENLEELCRKLGKRFTQMIST